MIVISAALKAQKKNNEFSQVDKIALQIPDSLSGSTIGISDYINSNFISQTEKSRAIFIWITTNIQYDIENMFAINFYQNTNEIIDKVLITRKGICMHYAELYHSIANQVGIKSYVVSGYTKQNGFVDYIPHAWIASFIDSTWYLVDPTWGSGYIQNAKFVKKTNDYYFRTRPEQMVKSHMPFDPLWQFLNYPVTNQEFYEGKTGLNKTKPYFNYQDTLSQFERETEIEKLESSSRRIEKNGVKNSLVFDRLQHNKREMEYYYNKIRVETYNSAVNHYNDGINQLNRFIDYRNKQFTPKKPDSEIREMVDLPEKSFINSREKLKEIKKPDPNTANSMIQLNKSIDEAMLNLNEQKAFLDKYFSTGKMFRKSLFYKYTWMGIPLN
ncbi:MAG: hypothetical protein BGP01_08175 [Paludibacter sp. 47-17]|nr:MAG: hypothetical protein BGP01_08175 [Paludibacter sp. 47-17]